MTTPRPTANDLVEPRPDAPEPPGLAVPSEEPAGALRRLFGSLKPADDCALTLEEIEDLAALGWAGSR